MHKTKKNILVIKHGALGDLMQSLGLLMDIRNHYPNSMINFLTAPAYCKLMQQCPMIDFVIADNRAPIWRIDQQIKLKQKIIKQKIDLVIDLQNSDRSRMYHQFWFSKTEWIGRSANENEPATGLSGLITLLNGAGVQSPHAYRPDLSWMIADISGLLDKNGVGKDYIVLIPGSSAQHLEKRWPYFGALANALIALGEQVVVIVGPDEVDLAKDMPGCIVKDLDWFTLAGVLNGSKYVIGNDTGPSHIASYLNKRGLAIFGPTTSADRAEIGRRNFETIEVDDLSALTVETVMKCLPKYEKLFKTA
ncbi:MAG: glycosyltransferase family 9 protein [Methylotenera sp.]